MNTTSYPPIRRLRKPQIAGPIAANLHTQILRLRQQKGWSQEQLAYEANVSRSTVQKTEDGNMPRATTLRKFAAAFGFGDDISPLFSPDPTYWDKPVQAFYAAS